MSIDTNNGSSFLVKKWFREVDGSFRLLGSKCGECGKISFPEKRICPQCAADDLATVPLSSVGRLHTFALTVLGPKDIDAPYVIGFIDLPEGIKLYSIISSDSPNGEDLTIGMQMEMVIDRIKQDEAGNDILSYKFKPVQGDN